VQILNLERVLLAIHGYFSSMADQRSKPWARTLSQSRIGSRMLWSRGQENYIQETGIEGEYSPAGRQYEEDILANNRYFSSMTSQEIKARACMSGQAEIGV